MCNREATELILSATHLVFFKPEPRCEFPLPSQCQLGLCGEVQPVTHIKYKQRKNPRGIAGVVLPMCVPATDSSSILCLLKTQRRHITAESVLSVQVSGNLFYGFV